MRAAQGHVWALTTSSLEKPDHKLTVVSMLHMPEGVQYRLVGLSAAAYPKAQPIQPSLEDGFVWLMKNAGQ
jgi:ABC-2 type transport system ATP-binding protein